MKGIEVIFGNGNRKVWQADTFYLEQVAAGRNDPRTGMVLTDSRSYLVIGRAARDEWGDKTDAPPTVLVRIPRWSFVFPIELAEDGMAPPRVFEDAGWTFAEQASEPELETTLPSSVMGRFSLPQAPPDAAPTITPASFMPPSPPPPDVPAEETPTTT